MFPDLSGLIPVLILFGAVIATCATAVLLAILKLCGVLLLSWWWIIGMIPAVIIVGIIVTIFIYGCKHIFS